jgi:glycine cleavage system H protein
MTKGMGVIPTDLRYTDKHEWVSAPSGATVRVGITDYAQEAMGDIVFVELPEAGVAVTAGAVFGEVESPKSVSEVYSPVSGTVVARNEQLTDHPDLINSDPYGVGWLIEIELEPTDAGELDRLLDADGYATLINAS